MSIKNNSFLLPIEQKKNRLLSNSLNQFDNSKCNRNLVQSNVRNFQQFWINVNKVLNHLRQINVSFVWSYVYLFSPLNKIDSFMNDLVHWTCARLHFIFSVQKFQKTKHRTNRNSRHQNWHQSLLGKPKICNLNNVQHFVIVFHCLS